MPEGSRSKAQPFWGHDQKWTKTGELKGQMVGFGQVSQKRQTTKVKSVSQSLQLPRHHQKKDRPEADKSSAGNNQTTNTITHVRPDLSHNQGATPSQALKLSRGTGLNSCFGRRHHFTKVTTILKFRNEILDKQLPLCPPSNLTAT